MPNTLDCSEIHKNTRQCFSSYTSNRKLVAATVICFLILLYTFPNWFDQRSLKASHAVAARCLDNQLNNYYAFETAFQVHFQHRDFNFHNEKTYIPFVGNGRMGVSFGMDQRLRLASKRVLALQTDFYPLVSLQIERYDSSTDAYVTDYEKGHMKHIQSYAFDNDCVIVASTVYAHRKRPNLLIQEVQIDNPTERSIEVSLTRPKCNWQEETRRIGTVPTKVFTTKLDTDSIDKTQILPNKRLDLRQDHIRFTTVVDYSQPATNVSSYRRAIIDNVVRVLTRFEALTPSMVNKEHESGWRELNEASFGLSYSLAPETLNADLLNATRYAVLSNLRAPLLEQDVLPMHKNTLLLALAKSELCYDGHSTLMFPSKLWQPMDTIDQLVTVAETWMITLEKRGCMHLVRAGAIGTAQAMLLSMGPFRFSHHHLELAADPSDLHREKKTQFPVKLTQPLTPILYVTSDRSHLEELRRTIHVKEVVIAPAHENDVLALHRHGHQLGGLPMIFWVTLAFLVIAFHLFLCKLIYNEWLRTDTVKTTNFAHLTRQRYVR